MTIRVNIFFFIRTVSPGLLKKFQLSLLFPGIFFRSDIPITELHRLLYRPAENRGEGGIYIDQVTIHQKTATADTIRQRFVIAAPYQKEATLARILKAEPIDGVIVFVKMRSTTEPLVEFLSQHGHRAAALNGDIAQKQREKIVDQLRSGRIDILVATDVAARGLDVQRVSHVINYDLPVDSEAYVHRIGRTGRAGRSGEAILFVHPRDRYYMPGQAPSRAILESETVVKDGRGQVNRYEYSRGNSFIARETWQDERGESQGRFGIGRKF